MNNEKELQRFVMLVICTPLIGVVVYVFGWHIIPELTRTRYDSPAVHTAPRTSRARQTTNPHSTHTPRDNCLGSYAELPYKVPFDQAGTWEWNGIYIEATPSDMNRVGECAQYGHEHSYARGTLTDTNKIEDDERGAEILVCEKDGVYTAMIWTAGRGGRTLPMKGKCAWGEWMNFMTKAPHP